MVENSNSDATIAAPIPTADKTNRTVLANAIPIVTNSDRRYPLDAPSTATAKADGPGANTIKNVVTENRVSASIVSIVKFLYDGISKYINFT